MGQAEYIVRFKGDYSALQKDINKIAGETKKLSDDEVIIKLAYDGNIKEFNKVFNRISEMHPELGIQFQYNVNQKILEQETDKLKKLTDIKIDVDENKAQKKLENLADYVETALMDGLSKDEINKRVRDVFGYYNTAIKAGAKNIDFGSIRNRLLDSFSIKSDEIADIYAEIADRNINKPIELFKINTSINDEITKTTDRINDLQESLKYLEGKGASKTGLPTELEKVQDEIKILRSDIEEMRGQLKNLSGEAFDKMTESIKETNQQLDITKERLKIVQDFLKNNGSSEALNFTEALNKLQGMLSTFYKENNGNHVSSFWDELIKKAQDGDEEVLQLLSDLRLLKDNNLPDKVNAGMVKSGGLIGDDYTVLTTKIHSDRFSGDRLKDAEELKNRLDAISNSGVNVARILSIVSDEVSNLYVEIQQTAPGKMLGQIYGQTDKDWVNTDFFEATDEEILKLIVDLETLRKAGIGVELNTGNLLYQKGKGFSIIDMDLNPLQDYEETISESQNILLDSIRQFYEEQTDETGKIKAEAQEAITALDLFSNRFGAIAAEKRELIDKLSTEGANNNQISINDAATKATQEAADALQEAQDSNSPAELTKPLGKDFGLGYAEGIREAMPEIVNACKEVVLAAYNAIKETKTSEDGEGVDFSEGFINSFKESLDKAVPTIQEKIKEVFSKINIGDENSSMFEGIGEEIIDSIIVGLKNAHSGESFVESLENIINSAFTQVALDSAVRDFLIEIQTNLDTQGSLRLKYFSVDTDSIVYEIQNGLDNNTFNINLGGTIKDLSTALNTSADNVRLSFIDALKWMREADKYQIHENNDPGNERVLYFNTKTGEFSNPTIYGNQHSAPWFFDMAKNQGTKFDTHLHTHIYDDYAFPSSGGNNADGQGVGDVEIFFKNAYNKTVNSIFENISKFVVGAQKEYAVFDFSKVASNAEELRRFLENWIKENINSVERVLGDERVDDYRYSKDVDKARLLAGEYVGKILERDAGIFLNEGITTRSGLANAIDNILSAYDDNKAFMDLSTGIYGMPYKRGKSQLLDSGVDEVISLFKKQIFDMPIDQMPVSIDDITDIISEIGESVFTNDKYSTVAIDYWLPSILKIGDFLKQQILDSSYSHDASWEEAGSLALRKLSQEDSLISQIVKYYTPKEFEREFGAKLPAGTTNNTSSQTPFSPTLSPDFQQQLQNSIDESGKYIIKVYGELVNDFKSQLQQNLDELGTYFIEIKGMLSENFRSDLISDMESYSDPYYYITVKGKLIETFKEVLQETIDGLGAFPIQVKPYVRKGEEIEEVDKAKNKHYLTDNDGNKIKAFRGLENVFGAGLSSNRYHGGSFWTDDVGLAANYGTKIDSGYLSMDNPIEYFGHGEEWDQLDLHKMYLQQIDDYCDETQKEIDKITIKLSSIKDSEENLPQLDYGEFGVAVWKDEGIEGIDSLDKFRELFYGIVDLNNPEISLAISQLYENMANIGRLSELKNKDFLNTNEVVEIGQILGKDGVIFHNIRDGSPIPADIFVTFNQAQIDFIETLGAQEAAYQEQIYHLNNELGYPKSLYDQIKNKNIDQLESFAKEIVSDFDEGYFLGVFEKIYDKYSNSNNYKEAYDAVLYYLKNLKEAYDELGDYDSFLSNQKNIQASLTNVSNQTPVSTESTEAETKALLSKKEVVEQLRTELNLTKKAAEELFDAQGYNKTNNKYQLEQTAVDELIASLKEKKQVEESQDSFTTSPTANAMQSEVEAVNQAIDAENKKFDELKNKISKTIPTAINKKNQAFEKERDLVAKVVDDEVDYFDVLKDSINSVTNTIEKQYDTTKNAKPKADKSNNKSSNNKSSSNKSDEPDKDALLQQHYVDLRKDAYQSFGQKSDIQKEMSKYYSQLEKESSDIYSSANKKANGLLDKIKKLNFDKYTQDFIDELKSAESELTDFLNQLKAGVVPLDEIDNRISVLATNIEDTLSKKALGNVKKAGEKTLSNITLKIDQIIAKNSAMGKQYEDRFKGLRKELEEAENVD